MQKKQAKPLARFKQLSLHGNEIIKVQGESLPHWTCEHAIYHVSFRLADSVPKQTQQVWIHKRLTILDNAKVQQRPLTSFEHNQLNHLYSQHIDQYLKAGHGECYLAKPAIAEIVANALNFFNGQRYILHAWCIMPNHVHVIIEPILTHALSDIIHSWKSFTANKANKLLHLNDSFWQKDTYNHIIRSASEYGLQIDYTWENPDKAGINNWKWRWKK